MAKGYRENQERLEAVSQLGKPLARRSGSRCELCQASGQSLRIFEVPPAPAEPELDHCALLCDACIGQLAKPAAIEPSRWHCLRDDAWSNIPAVQVLAVRLLRHLHAAHGQGWCGEVLADLDLDPDIASWAAKAGP